MGTLAPLTPQAEDHPALSTQISSPALLEKIEQSEAFMLDMPQVACSVTHHFGKGVCIREVRIPAGTFSIGHFQKTEHINNFIKGRVLMLNDDGKAVEIAAPLTYIGKPGRKVGLILEDMIWQNIYVTDETDIEAIEALFIDKSKTWLEHDANKQLLQLTNKIDTDDFQQMLVEIGFDAETVRSQSENEDDQIQFPAGHCMVKIGNSSIEGRGLFATSDIAMGEIIAPARLGGMRTPAGRYANHAKKPNAEIMIDASGDVYLIALRDIKGCMGGNDGEEITIDYRQVIMQKNKEVICQ